MPDILRRHPAHRPPVALTAAEARLLRLVLRGCPADGVEPWTFYSGAASPRTDTSRLNALRCLEPTGVVDVFSGAAMGWGASTWGVRLTCVGANALYRFDGDVHTDCPVLPDAAWQPGGVCVGCNRRRPLDHAYLKEVSPHGQGVHLSGPRLYCIEHGWVRHDDVRTAKVCGFKGTVFHDGGLDRL